MKPTALRPLTIKDVIAKEKKEKLINKYLSTEKPVKEESPSQEEDQENEMRKKNPFAVNTKSNIQKDMGGSLLGELSKDFKLGQKRPHLNGPKVVRGNVKKL